jgi:serine/threonine protein kinase
MAQVDHPNVVKVYGVIPSGRWPQIVMQYVPSRSLLGVIRVDGPLAPPYVALDGDQPDEPMAMGTALYVAPGRVVSGECTAAGDFWSLGATLYTAVEGHAPYAAHLRPKRFRLW